MLGMIKRTISYKNERIMLSLYKTLVRPLLEYCTPVWSPHYIKDKQLLERIQHRFTRLVPGFRVMAYEDRLRRLGLWTLEERRNRADLIEVFKMYKGVSGLPLQSMFQLTGCGRTRGHCLKLVKHRNRLDLRKYFFSERVINRWNALNDDTVLSGSVNGFKRQLAKIRDVKKGFFMPWTSSPPSLKASSGWIYLSWCGRTR